MSTAFSQSLGRILRVLVFAFLLLSAMAGVFFSEHLWLLWEAGKLPLWAPLAPPISFFLFMVAFAIDRFHAVQRRNLQAYRALFHLGAAVVFFMLLLPHEGRHFGGRTQGPGARGHVPPAWMTPSTVLLGHPDDSVRAAFCMFVAAQPRAAAGRLRRSGLNALLAEHAQTDSSEVVRQACHEALRRLGPGAPQPHHRTPALGLPNLEPQDAWDADCEDEPETLGTDPQDAAPTEAAAPP